MVTSSNACLETPRALVLTTRGPRIDARATLRNPDMTG